MACDPRGSGSERMSSSVSPASCAMWIEVDPIDSLVRVLS